MIFTRNSKEDVLKLKWKISSFDEVYVKVGWFGYCVVWDRKLRGFNNRRSRVIYRTSKPKEAYEIKIYFNEYIRSKRPKRSSPWKK